MNPVDNAFETSEEGIAGRGDIVTQGPPAVLRAAIGGDLIMLRSARAADLLASLQKKYTFPAYIVDDIVRVECPDASAMIPELLRQYGDDVDMVTFSRPSIEDVYIRKTGHRFRSDNP